MEKINKKLFHIEKTLDKMKKEISSIKSITYNTNATNSFNNSNNFTNKNFSLNFKKDNYQKNRNINILKNYFKLTEKEKQYYENKKRMQSPLSFHMKGKKYNLNNLKYDYSSINNSIDDTLLIENDKNKTKYKQNIKSTYNNKRFNRIAILNENKNDSSFENNFDFESHNIFFNYNSNGQNKCNRRVFSNIMKKNSNENRNKYLNNYSMDCRKRMNGSLDSKIYNINYDETKGINNKICYGIKNIVNDKNKVSKLKLNKKNNNSIFNKDIDDEYYISNNNSKKKTFEENGENINLYNYKKYENNKKLGEKYSEILNILDGKSLEEIKNKSILFDKYGLNGFKNFLDNNNIKYNSSQKNFNSFFKYLVNYKKYIKTLKANKEYMNKIYSYKILCDNLLKIGNRINLQKIEEKINNKLKKNQHNKKVLEKIKNILFELNNNHNIY